MENRVIEALRREGKPLAPETLLEEFEAERFDHSVFHFVFLRFLSPSFFQYQRVPAFARFNAKKCAGKMQAHPRNREVTQPMIIIAIANTPITAPNTMVIF